MIVGIKDTAKLFAISVVVCCAVFVCALFLNYNLDIVQIKDEITTVQGMTVYDAQVMTGKVVIGVTGGCLAVTTIILLIFYVKNYIDSHGKELGILKALGYSDFNIAKHFWIFGLSVFIGAVLGFIAAFCYMPEFYDIQNADKLLPKITPSFQPVLCCLLIVLPTVFFVLLAVVYAFFKLKKPVIMLIKDIQKVKVRKEKREEKERPFMRDLRVCILRSRKTPVFFVGFSAFCFSAMTQMSMSMDELASETMAVMILTIGLILAFMTLMMSLSGAVKSNAKTIAMMKIFGYSERECSGAVLGGYRPVSYIGFAVGTAYQYFLLRIMVDIVFADVENIPEFKFDFTAFAISLVLFFITYELFMYIYSQRIKKLSIKSIMLE